MNEAALKIVLPWFSLVYFAVCFVWRTYSVWKRTKVFPIAFGKSDSAHDFIGLGFRLIGLSALITVIVYSYFDEYYLQLNPLNGVGEWGSVAGQVMLIVSLVGCAVAQAQMGKSWRIGVDTQNPTSLIEVGLFRISRNPIYFFIFLGAVGFFLILPNSVSLIVVVLAFFLIQIQVRLEEEFLERVHGDYYKSYKLRVRRWL